MIAPAMTDIIPAYMRAREKAYRDLKERLSVSSQERDREAIE